MTTSYAVADDGSFKHLILFCIGLEHNHDAERRSEPKVRVAIVGERLLRFAWKLDAEAARKEEMASQPFVTLPGRARCWKGLHKLEST